MLNFNFKNDNGLDYNSLKDFGIWMPSKPIIPRAERNFNTYELEGRDGILTEDIGTYKPIKIPISCEIINYDLLNTKLELLYLWLCGVGGELRLSHYKNRFLKAYYVEQFEPEEILKSVHGFNLNFVCEAFKYTEDGTNLITLTSPGSIINDGYASKPYLKIYGTGNVTLTINSKNILLTGINEYIEIDSDMENCFKGTDPANDQMTGQVPILNTGENSISWTGSVSKIELLPRWRWL